MKLSENQYIDIHKTYNLMYHSDASHLRWVIFLVYIFIIGLAVISNTPLLCWLTAFSAVGEIRYYRNQKKWIDLLVSIDELEYRSNPVGEVSLCKRRG